MWDKYRVSVIDLNALGESRKYRKEKGREPLPIFRFRSR